MSELNTGKYQAYPEYKDSSSKWLDSIPSHWKVTFLKHVLSTPITDGPHSTPVFIDEGIPFVSAEAVSGGYIDFDKIRGFISKEDDAFFSQKYSPKRHDVYMIKSGATTGITAIVETDKHFNIWSPLAVMRCKNTYNPYFLLNSLRSDFFQKSVQLSWTFGTQQNIGMGTLENLTVCYPPLEEQIQIANFLDHETAKIDNLIEKQQQLIKLLKEKRQAVISHVVTKGLNPQAPTKDSGVEWLGEIPEHWVVSKFGYISQVVRGGSPRPAGDPTLFNGDYSPWVTVAEITKDDEIYLTETETFLTRKGSGQCRVFSSGTLLLSNSGATLGVPAILKIDANANDGVVGFESLNVDTEFAYFYLSTLTEDLRERVKQGSGQPNLNTDIVKDISIPIPPKGEVRQIVSSIHKLRNDYSKLIIKATSAIKLMKERRTALISAAVTGKIDVRNWEQPND